MQMIVLRILDKRTSLTYVHVCSLSIQGETKEKGQLIAEFIYLFAVLCRKMKEKKKGCDKLN